MIGYTCWGENCPNHKAVTITAERYACKKCENMLHIYNTFVECVINKPVKKSNNMNVYRITSDIFSNESDFVVAENITSAISTYIKRYSTTEHIIDETNITSVERIAEKCLISEK